MVNFTDIVTEEFLLKYTSWKSFVEFEQNSPLKIQENEYWQFIDNPDFNDYISSHSVFSSWNILVKQAAQDIMARHIKV